MKEAFFEGLARERQCEVIRAVHQGAVLADPAEAAVAVRYARSLLERGRYRWLSQLAAAGAVAYLAVELIGNLSRSKDWAVPDTPTIVLFFYLLSHVYAWFAGRELRKNALEAERLNLHVAESAGLTVELTEAAPTIEPVPVPAVPKALPPPRRPSAVEVLLGLSVTVAVSLAMLPERHTASAPVGAVFGFIAFGALVAAVTATVLAYRASASTGPAGAWDAKMRIGIVVALFWAVMLVVLVTTVR
jgi:hypothetical protein